MLKPRLIRITTVPLSFNVLLKGQLAFMKAYFNILAVSSGPTDQLNEVQIREGVPVKQIEMTRSLTPFKDLISLWQLFRLFRGQKPFIVHTHTPKAGTLGMIAARLAGVPVRLHTVAGLPLLEVHGARRKLLDIVEKITYACATKVYPNSSVLKDIIIEEKYCSSGKLKVLGAGSSNGIDTTYFDPAVISVEEVKILQNTFNIQPHDFVFIFVGRLVTDKGLNELVKAFKELDLSPGKTAKLLLVGPKEDHLDPLHGETDSEISQNPNIMSVGFQKDVRPFFAISHALAFPSYREGFPNVVMQAGAMGLPSIVSNINGCNEIIEEGKNGLIIPVKNHIALREAMKSFIENTDLYEKLKLNARPMICNRYEQKIVWEALLNEYQIMLT